MGGKTAKMGFRRAASRAPVKTGQWANPSWFRKNKAPSVPQRPVYNALSWVEATVGFEPTNRGFADPRLRPLGYVAPNIAGAEEEIRSWPYRPVIPRAVSSVPVSDPSAATSLTYYPVPSHDGKCVGKMSATTGRLGSGHPCCLRCHPWQY